MEQSMTSTRTSSSKHSKASSLENVSIQLHQEWKLYEAEVSTFVMEMTKKEKNPQQILEHVGKSRTGQKGMFQGLFLFERLEDNNTWEVLKKFKEEVIQIRSSKRDQAKVLTRSLSVGSPRRSSADNVNKLDRFKIRTLDVKQGGGGAQLGGSK